MNIVDNIEVDFRDIVVHDGLTDKQNAYVYWRELGFTPRQAAKRAGYGCVKTGARDNENNPQIRELLDKYVKDNRPRLDVDRNQVVEGIMEALAVAREQSDPKVMIQAWTEIARITGVQAPVVTKVEHEHGGTISVNHMKEVSDQRLLQMLGKKRELDYIEDAEYEVVEHAEDAESEVGQLERDD